ncbi:MAG: S-layer homology domain-containing protein [Actinomycetota bacterium]
MRTLIRKSPIASVLAALVLGGGLFLGGAASAGNVFNDTPPWIHDHAAWLAKHGVAAGFPDGSFRPDDDISRGQAAFWFGNYNDAIHHQIHTVNYSSSTFEFVNIDCPGDMRAVAGGGHAGQLDLVGSYPIFNAVNGPGWQVDFRSHDGTPKTGTINAHVLCMPSEVGP